MCAQCMAGAATAGAAATGLRAWLATRSGAWLPPRLRRVLLTGTLALGLAGAALLVGP
jgi:hypothetical protein